MAQMTTAQALVAFDKELRDGGIAAHLVDDLVRIFAREIAGGGFLLTDDLKA